MPEDFEPTEEAQSTDFQLTARGGPGGQHQASETYVARSTGVRPLGEGGEQVGIAKMDVDRLQVQVWNQRDAADIQAKKRLGELEQDLNNQIGALDPNGDPNIKTDLERQLNWVKARASDGTFDVGSYEGTLTSFTKDQLKDLELSRDLSMQSNKLAQTVNSTAYLFSESPYTGVNRPGPNKAPNDLHLLSRAVASSQVDELIGTNVLAKEKFGVDSQGRPVGISVGVDGFGVTGNAQNGKQYFMDIDYSSHNVQKGLYDLEALDYITGQVDRHAGNIFIDPATGQVKGIDNDLAFPQVSRDHLFTDAGGDTDLQAKPVANLPRYMHSETARKIESTSPDALRAQLSSVKYPGGGGKLTDAEIDGAVTRLQEMQSHIRTMRESGRVVDTFDKQTYNEAIQAQEKQVVDQCSKYWNGGGIEKATSADFTDARKTSYIGTVDMERRKNELGLDQNQTLKLDANGVRNATNSTGKIDRSPEHAKYKEKADQTLAQKKGEARHNMTKAELKELRELQKDLDHYENRLDKLDHHNAMASLKSLRYGGVDNAKDAFHEKRLHAMQKLKDIDDRLNDQAKQMLDGEKRDLMKSAKKEVDDERSLNQSQGVDMGHSQSQTQSQSSSKSVKDDGPGIDGDDALSELESELEVEAPKAKVGVDGQQQTQKQPEPKGMEVGGVKKITARFEVGNVSNITDPTKSTLQRKDSVRESMKESGIVRLGKGKFEVDGDSNKVRQTARIRTGGEGEDQPQESQKQKTGVKGMK
ncbi:phosphatidylinositol 3-/4-kinase [Roseimicrobium gellanilyticum]|uniref:Phosphatidylinositol 3-/4-kinase n=1 Tax=Roseimicrobium gellanilyticum TaxID=748857 RepID=A0A366HFU2_9BACT|nr:hypothetical protein [Roseimicrobium gellanilyticum]RBP40544.1 phosphatidylinositol 3-/4-kinase [Roseimicrobium gellanilyticum]